MNDTCKENKRNKLYKNERQQQNLIVFEEFKFTKTAIYELMALLQLSLLTDGTPSFLVHLATTENFAILFLLGQKDNCNKLSSVILTRGEDTVYPTFPLGHNWLLEIQLNWFPLINSAFYTNLGKCRKLYSSGKLSWLSRQA